MEDLSQILLKKIKYFQKIVFKNITIIFTKSLSLIELVFLRIKTLLEIKKLEWDLDKSYKMLGMYIFEKNSNLQVTDFSHDTNYINRINNIVKQSMYIKKLRIDLSQIHNSNVNV